MFENYLKKIIEITVRGDAREESYYNAFQSMIENFAYDNDIKNITITSQPKKTDKGNPDFRVWDGKQKIVGYIEAKAPYKELEDIKDLEQIKRYKNAFKNFILTNFFEFWLYREEICIDKIKISELTHIVNPKNDILLQNEDKLVSLLKKFFSFSLPRITSGQTLAIELAKRTRFLRDEVIAEELREEENEDIKKIIGFYIAFKTFLIKDLDKEQFADLYSQTITYGLFASRMRCKTIFNRKLAVYDIPHSIGILREMFEFISLGELPPKLEWIIDEISDILANVEVDKIFLEYYQNKKGEDPVFHFYETFLSEYNPEERERRGVYYTPIPVVSFIVNSLNIILKEKFSISDGFANENITILDPAAGTLTFIVEAIKLAVKEFISKYGEGSKDNFIKNHILQNFYAFELMVAPYAIGHLKISFLLDELKYNYQKEERLKFYLTNTLEMEEIEQTALPGMASLARESHSAGVVKKKTPILVILGNPPYSGHSANKGEWITQEIKSYYSIDGVPLNERNTKWIQDDYVKFIRFAQWKIDEQSEGVLGFITNHAYLNNPTFRAMRYSLLKSFNEIYIINLHGNSSIKEKSPDGTKDENVFDIKQGVSISLFIKNNKLNNENKVNYIDLWGLREYKYNWLLNNTINSVEWNIIRTNPNLYLFVPRNEDLLVTFNNFIAINDIFPVYNVGVQTHRDEFVVDINKEKLQKRIQDFMNNDISDSAIKIKYNINETNDWKLEDQRKKVLSDTKWKDKIIKYHFRPFDIGWIFYNKDVVDRPRQEIMQHMIEENLGLLCMKQFAYEVKDYNYVFITNGITDSRIFISNKGAAYLFPLYLYSYYKGIKKIIGKDDLSKNPNINNQLLSKLFEYYKIRPKPEELLFYIYGILYSNIYRLNYFEYLKTEFPRIPITINHDLFIKMSILGEKLIKIHLMNTNELENSLLKFEGNGDNIVSKILYNEKENKLFINENQYFYKLTKDVWEYQIGGYNVIEKYLKDRKNLELSFSEIKVISKIVLAIELTIKIQDEIDTLYPEIEKDVITLKKSVNNIKQYFGN